MFKVGDEVLIVRKVEQESGWANNWVPDMDGFVGKETVLKVAAVTNNGVYFAPLREVARMCGAPEIYGWPNGALEHAKG